MSSRLTDSQFGRRSSSEIGLWSEEVQYCMISWGKETTRGSSIGCATKRVWFWRPVGSLLSCVVRSSVQDPPSNEVSRCLAGFLRESHDSGLGLGLDALAVLRGVKKGLPCILGAGREIRDQG